MENRKDIGKAFREKLEGIEKSPKNEVWNSVNAELIKHRKQAFITKWLRATALTGVAALIITLFTYPLWKEYVPHIYMVMPNEKIENGNHEIPEKKRAAGSNAATNYHNAGTDGSSTNTAMPGSAAKAAKEDAGEATFDGFSNTSNPGNNSNAENTISGKTKIRSTSSGNTLSGVKDNKIYNGKENSNTREAYAGTFKENATLNSNRKSSNILKTVNKTQNSPSNNATKATNANENSIAISYNKNISHNSAANTDNVEKNSNSTNRPYVTDINNIKDANTSRTNNTKGDNGSNTISATPGQSRRNNTSSTEDRSPGNNENKLNLKDTDTLATDVATTVIDTLSNTPIKAEKLNTAKIADSLNKLYNREEKISDKKKRDTIPFKKIYVHAFAGPMQFALPKSGTYIDNSLQDNAASSKTSFAYGAYLGYNITRRLSVRIGAIKTKSELATNNVTIQNTNLRGIEYNEGMSNAAVTEQLANGMNEGLPTAVVTVRNNFEFIEIPIELTYRLYEGKFGIGLLGGYVTRYTKENKVFAANEIGSLEVGKMKKLEDANTGVSFGGSFHYKIMPNLQLNIEPVYKYFFNKDQFLRQHTYSIQAGLRFDFGFMSKKK